MNLNLTVMMYHYVRDAGDAAEAGSGIPGLPVHEFSTQLDQLGRDYEMVSWQQVRASVLGEAALPERACLLTFDDGVCDHYLNVFPELEHRNLSGLFFALARRDDNVLPIPFKLHYLLAKLGMEQFREEILNRLTEPQREIFFASEPRYRQRWGSDTDAFKGVLQRELEDGIEPLLTELLETQVGAEPELARRLFLNETQMREMQAGGMHMGGHSQTHPWFDFIDARRRENEIRASCRWLAAIEQPPFAFAYPYGGLAEDAPRILAQNEFRAAFTTRSRTAHDDPFYIGRFDGEAFQKWSADNGSG